MPMTTTSTTTTPTHIKPIIPLFYSVQVSAADAQAYKNIGGVGASIDSTNNPHLARWHAHIGSFSESERARCVWDVCVIYVGWMRDAYVICVVCVTCVMRVKCLMCVMYV